MTDFAITLSIPEYLYERAKRLAAEKNLAIEQVLIDQLETALVDLPALASDEQAELDALDHLSDDALRTIALEVMPLHQQERMQGLMQQNNFGTISAEAREELTGLVDQGQRLILRKAKAIALLAQRGHPISLES
jgi:hypothetical protein